MFFKGESTGKDKTKKAAVAGNTFYLLLSENTSPNDVERIINIAWPMFLWLYPSKPLFVRDASLNRSLKKIKRQCEFKKIQNMPFSKCKGEIEAAHIKPHAKGGSDKLYNGIWLCKHHHKKTEGKLKGSRTLTDITVVYKEDKLPSLN